MAKEITKILGQDVPSVINTEKDLYFTPADRQSVISSIVVTNESAGAITFKLAVVPDKDNTTTAVKHYIRFNKSIAIAGNDDIKLGITMDEFSVIRFEASSVLVGFSVFGVELGQEE